MTERPGAIVLFGSGETAASGRKVYESVLTALPPRPHLAILETPAGFEPNSAHVAGQVADYFALHLHNFHPQITVVAARKRGTAFSPDDPAIVAPLEQADVIFLGPGSPTYAVRQLDGSLAWNYVVARHRLGSAIILASATTIAASAFALPVYEIYKVGADLRWEKGLDLFGPYGLTLVLIPHWDNTEGGSDLDTSRCYMGKDRFDQLQSMLPPEAVVVGIDEHTAALVDVWEGTCHVMGLGGLTIIRRQGETRVSSGHQFPLAELGSFRLPRPGKGVPAAVWQRIQKSHAERDTAPAVPADIRALVRARERARARHDFATADDIRDQIAARGWSVIDLPDGPSLSPAPAPDET